MSVKQTGGRIIVVSTEEGDFVSSLARTKMDGTRQLKFSGDMDLETNKIVNITDPTTNQEIATKAYADAGGSTPAGSNTQVQYNTATTLRTSLRANASYVTDTDEFIVCTSNTATSTNRNDEYTAAQGFGMIAGTYTSANFRDRSTTFATQLAGMTFQSTNGATFRMDLPEGAGEYKVWFAGIDAAGAQTTGWRFKDGTGGTEFATLDSATTATQYVDINNTQQLASSFDINGSNYIQRTFTNDHFTIVRDTALAAGNGVISAVWVENVAGGSFGAGAGFVFDGSGNVTATDSVEIDRIGIGGQNPNEIRTNNNISLQNMAIDPVNNNGFVINSTEHYNPTVTEGFLFVHGTDAEPLGEGRVGQHLTSSGNLGKSTNIYQTLYLTYHNRQRSDDATAEIYPGGNYNSFEMPTDGNALFEYLIVGTTDDGTNQKRNAYRYNGLIKNNDGTGSFVGTPTKTAIASGSPDLDVTLSLSSNTPSTGDVSLILKGIHGSNSTTHWCAKMTAVEVRGEASGAPIPFHGGVEGTWSTVGNGILGG